MVGFLAPAWHFPYQCGCPAPNDLRGPAIHIIMHPLQPAGVFKRGGFSTASAAMGDAASRPANGCAGADPAAWSAFAVMAGVLADGPMGHTRAGDRRDPGI